MSLTSAHETIKHGLKIPVDAPDYAVFVTRMANAEQEFMKVFSM